MRAMLISAVAFARSANGAVEGALAHVQGPLTIEPPLPGCFLKLSNFFSEP